VIATLAGVAGPLALFAMGVSLWGYGIRGQVRQALSLVYTQAHADAGRGAWHGAIAIGLPELQAKIAVAAASLPAGVNSWLIASRLGTGQRLASTSMTIGTALAAVTTGMWLLIAEAML
jgi:malonate transporter